MSVNRVENKKGPKKVKSASSHASQAGRKKRRKKKVTPIVPLLKKRGLVLLRKFMRNPSVPIAAGVVLVLLISIWLVWLFTNKNGYEVFVNGESVGIIAVNKKNPVTEKELYATAIERIVRENDANVKTNEALTGKPVHAKKKALLSTDRVTEEIYKKLTYQVEAASIKLDGIEMCIVKNMKAAEEIKKSIISKYIHENSNIVESESDIVEDLQMVNIYVGKEDIIPDEKAYVILTANTDSEEAYTVKSGDTVSKICTIYGMTEAQLFELNPSISSNAYLKIGQQLKVVVAKPLLSVKTVEAFTYTTIAEKTVEERPNPARSKGYRYVIQQGSNGEQEVTEHITYINGVETDRRIVSKKISIDPVAEIVEIGTK